MKYHMIGIEIRTVASVRQDGTRVTQNVGNKYIYAELMNLQNLLEPTRKVTIFSDALVARFSEFLPATKGGTATEEKPIPQELTIVNGTFADWKYPGGLFYKTYPVARTLRDGTTVNAGDRVCHPKTKKPLVFDTLTVFATYAIDDDGSRVWTNGQTPAKIAEQLFRSFCEPVENTMTEETQEDPGF